MNDDDPNKLLTAREAIEYFRPRKPTLEEVELANAKYLEEQQEEKRRRAEAERRGLEARQLRESLGTENRNATILRWAKEGKRQAVIAREFKISAGRVGQICREQAEREAKKIEQTRRRETLRVFTKGVQLRGILRNLRIITAGRKAKAAIVQQWQERRNRRGNLKVP